MVAFTSIPVVGKTASGQPASMLYVADNNRSLITTNAQSVGTTPTTSTPSSLKSNPTWTMLKAKSIDVDGSKVIVQGDSTDSTGKTRSIAWVNLTGDWSVGLTPASNTVSGGVASQGANFLVSDPSSSKVYQTKFSYAPSSPAGGFNDKLPEFSTVATEITSVSILSNNGSVVVAGTPSSIGTWTNTSAIAPGGSWKRQVGEAELVLTNHKSTSYTFPGSSANNIQRIGAIPNGDQVPTKWDNNTELANGYYGVIGGPRFTNTWVKPGA